MVNIVLVLEIHHKKNPSNDMESHGINDDDSSGSKELKDQIGFKKSVTIKKGSEGSKEIGKPCKYIPLKHTELNF